MMIQINLQNKKNRLVFKFKSFFNSYILGLLGELIAFLYLSFKFYLFVSHRYKNRYGEIDFIFYKKKQIIFIEIKLRKTIENFENIVSNKQIEKIKKASQLFLIKNKIYKQYLQRYDIIYICIKPFKIHHIKNI